MACMSNILLTTHIPTEIVTTTFCLFHSDDAKHNQEFGSGISQAGEDLETREKPLNSGTAAY